MTDFDAVNFDLNVTAKSIPIWIHETNLLTCRRSAVWSPSLGSCSWDLFSFPIHTPAEPNLALSLVALCAFKVTVVFALGNVYSFAGLFPFNPTFTHSLALGFPSMVGDFV